MTLYLYAVFTLLLALVVATAHTATIRKYGRANRNCLWLMTALCVWAALHFLAKLQTSAAAAGFIYHLLSPAWLLLGVLFFQFCEVFGNQPRPRLRKIYWGGAILASLAACLTSWVLDGAVESPYGWVDRVVPAVHMPVSLVVVFWPVMHGVGLLVAARRRIQSREMRQDYAIIFFGVGVALCGALVTDLLAPAIGGLEEIPQLALLLAGFFSLSIYAATVRRSFREYAMAHAAYDLFEELPVALLICDSQNEVVRGNDQVLRLFDCTADDLVGRALDEVLPGYASITLQVPVCLPKHKDRYVSISEARHSEGGVRTGMVVMIHDLTERVSAEQALQKLNAELEARIELRTQDLKEANRSLTEEMEARQRLQDDLIRNERLAAVGTLAGGVAHVFNNINTSVLGYAQLCELHEDLPDGVMENLQRISRAAERAREVTQGLLTFAGMRRGNVIRQDLNAIVKDVTEAWRQPVGLVPPSVQLHLSLEEIPELAVDFDEISEVVHQLCSNAEHALLGVENAVVTVRTWQEDEVIRLAVRDNGCGIAPEDLNLVFSPFFSRKGEHATSKSRQREVTGNGLGLSSCQAIAQHYGGEVTIESVLGQGSTVTLSLPVQASESTAEGAGSHERSLQGPIRRVVILDDEADILILLETFLTKRDYEVETFHEGPKVLDFLRRNPGKVDLVIVDLQMPALSGMEFLECMAAEFGGAAPPALVITGRLGEVDTERIKALGGRAVLRKPFDLPELLETIQSLHLTGF